MQEGWEKKSENANRVDSFIWLLRVHTIRINLIIIYVGGCTILKKMHGTTTFLEAKTKTKHG